MKTELHHIYYGWVIVAVSFFTLFLALGTRFSFGVFYVSILEEYGWGRAETAGAYSLVMVVHALFAPLTGTILDRFGPRTLFPLAGVLLAIGLAAASQTTKIWHLYLFFGIIAAIGINALSYSPHMALIQRWFSLRRGLASGLALSGIGMGTLVLAPLIEHMIHNLGWRHALLILSGAILCLLVPVTAIFQRRSPASIGQFPDGRDPETAQKHMPELKRYSPNVGSENYRRHRTLKASLQSKAFWCIALVVFCNGFLINMLVVHQVAHMVDLGYSPYLAATMLGIVGIMGSMGGILCGFLSDRLGREIGLTLGGCAAFTGVLILMLVREAASPWMLYAYATFYGLGQGAMGPMTATATGDLFPEHYLGRLLAVQSIGFGFGGALGAYAGGHFYDQTGSYFTAFLLVLISIGVGVVGIWIAAPRRRTAF